MAIFRGPGGSGDATTDSTTQALAAVNAANSAAASATLAASFTPSQTGNSGKYLTTNGTSTSWESIASSSGTVTSVGGTGTVNGISLSGTVTSSGNLTLGGTLGSITNSQLSNSSVTFNGQAVALGASGTITANTTNALTIGTGLSGNSFNGSSAVTVAIDSSVATLTGIQNLSNKTILGTKETIFAITDAAAFEINPANGGIQTITLGANRTPKGTNFTAGQSVTLMVTAGANTLTWTDTTFGTSGVKWIGATAPGSAPTLSTTAISIIELWEVGTQVYGAFVGVA